MKEMKRDQAELQAVTYVRGMEITDVEQVIQVEHASFTVPWTNDAFHNELTTNLFARYIVIEHEGRIAGYAGMWTILDEAHVTNIAVHPDFRRRGWGEWLLRELIARAIALGMVKMTLEVRVTNLTAQHLYRKFKFEPAGVRKGYYSDNQEDALIMWTDLQQLCSTQNEVGER
ncbi:ribosomal protein S18-alanine N-acetyltransferase [Paenibacillus sp. ACRRX]|uniref:ribosomal protein S18-alanine N-acetyltransferase n=1 Tax=unclassified Paenibacillus TaxID=185978 RepID=UPI001EF5561E|nr:MULTISPECIES: ribosomal protein S18-alanine N-acetyltransferase [unclassified Paenibacillus]MCG7408950.1 ribosomal protein S18-alanine N-acetyltransferase [Paenibacillus sp. ACRRX]MDK8182056.1 ribosomal protein S18-alanine N-acetyltransferase [Paenibacillus sp. UMB4589-SE434]